ncbi:MAG: arylsulfatase [Planctomycetota bacterium]|jgi:arylsulfatase A-like enzyme
MINRRLFLQRIALGAMGTVAGSLGCQKNSAWRRDSKKKPNVILVMTDDQGYGDFSCHGHPILKTPNIDALYDRSVRLTDFHVDPSCSPTRAALLTGRYAARAGVWDTSSGRQILRSDEVTMADVFRKNGYRTAIFGKWHLGHNYPYLPENRGFDEALVHYAGAIGTLPDYPGNDYYDDTYFRNGSPEKVSGYCTDVWFREAKRFIDRNISRPFFLYIPTNAPHGPYRVDQKYSKPYLKKGVSQDRAKYFGMCANIDENVGLLGEHLRDIGLEKNTIFIFLTDNGGTGSLKLDKKYHGFVRSGYNAGMRGAKQSMYEGGHRVPCFIRWPDGQIGSEPGRDVEQLTAHFDLFPTLIDLCNLNDADNIRFDGTSLAPLLRKKNVPWPERKLIVAVNRNENPSRWNRTAILTERWRLINGKELYDIAADPEQRRDIASKHLDVVTELRQFYDEYWKDISKRFGEYSRLVIGAPQANPTILCSHSLLESTRRMAVKVVRSGQYEISLVQSRPPEKAPLGCVEARIRIGNITLGKTIEPDVTAAVFTSRLVAGDAFLKTWLTDKKTAKKDDAKFIIFRYLEP